MIYEGYWCKVLLAEIPLEMGWKECNQSLSRISEEVAVHFRQDFVSIWGSDGDLDGGGGGDDDGVGDGDGDGGDGGDGGDFGDHDGSLTQKGDCARQNNFTKLHRATIAPPFNRRHHIVRLFWADVYKLVYFRMSDW